MEIAPPNPPSPPRTSGRRVDSTASRISSTARSPAATSTPDRAYAARVSPTGRHGLFEHELPAGRVVRNGLRVAPIEAGEAEAIVRQVEGGEDALDRQVAERIGADEVADLLDRARGGDQL